ncbi:MAG: hypothetical protein HOP34_00400 [Methylococcaceae bacterium]|nr:hypothetical protein [Methylococcaceae bacterium]
MAFYAKKYSPVGFGLLSILGAALHLFLIFMAGCSGDPKGGSFGDPVRALQLESFALFPLLLSVASGGVAFGLMSKSIHRVTEGLAFATFTLFCLWLTGMQFETWGVQSCF